MTPSEDPLSLIHNSSKGFNKTTYSCCSYCYGHFQLQICGHTPSLLSGAAEIGGNAQAPKLSSSSNTLMSFAVCAQCRHLVGKDAGVIREKALKKGEEEGVVGVGCGDGRWP